MPKTITTAPSLSGFTKNLAILSYDFVSADGHVEMADARAQLAGAIDQFKQVCHLLINPVKGLSANGDAMAEKMPGADEERHALTQDVERFVSWAGSMLNTPIDQLAVNGTALNDIRNLATTALLKRLDHVFVHVAADQSDTHATHGADVHALLSNILFMLSISVAHCLKSAGVTVSDEVRQITGPSTDDNKECSEDEVEVLTRILDNIGQGVLYFDNDLTLRVINQNFHEMLKDYQEPIQVGDPFRKIVKFHASQGEYGPGDIEAQIDERVKIIKKGQSRTYQRQTKDGRTMKLDVRHLTDAGFIALYKDITDEQSKDKEIQNKSQLLDLILDNIKHGIAWYDENLILQACNQRFYDLGDPSDDPVQIGESLEKVLRHRAECGHLGPGDIDQIVARNMALNWEFKYRVRQMHHNDGTIVRVEIHPIPGGGQVSLYSDVTEEVAKDQEILDKSHLLDLILDNVQHGIAWWDKDLVLQACNKRFYALGHPVDDPIKIGESVEEIFRYRAKIGNFGPGDIETLVAENMAMNFNFQHRIREMRNDDGTIVKVESHPIPGGGQVSLYSDVTEEQAKDREIREKSRSLDLILENVSQGIALFDQDDRLVAFNKQVTELMGCSPGQFKIGQTLEEFCSRHCALGASELQKFFERQTSMPESSQDLEFGDFECESENGTALRIEIRPVSDGGSVITYTDITTLKQRTQALEDQRQVQETILENLDQGVSMQNSDHLIMSYNKRYLDMFGVPHDAVKPGDHFSEFIKKYDDFKDIKNAEDQAKLDLRIEAATQFSEMQKRHKLKNGRVVDIRRVPLPNGGTVKTFTDMTDILNREIELKESRRAAETANKAKSEFLANMSHEIRTPMNGVLGMAEVLARTELNEQQSSYVDIITKSGYSLIDIINDILDFSKFEAGKLELDPRPFNLKSSIEDVATLMSGTAENKNLELFVRFNPKLPEKYIGDGGRVRQIITNLVGNAIKFTDEGHVLIDVDGSVNGDDVALNIRIVDTGIGIDSEKIARIFEKFEQVDNSSTRVYGGTGLGLAISKRLIELMGGEIGAESELTKGSTFWINLTLPANQKKSETPVNLINSDGLKVLVVDDIKVNQHILTEQLASWSMQPHCVDNGPRALEALKAAKAQDDAFDIAILDCQMPEMDGEELTRRIKSDPEIADVLLIMLTSIGAEGDARKMRELGVLEYLVKPARSAALLEAITTTLVNARGKDWSRNKTEALPRDAAGDASHVDDNSPVQMKAEPSPDIKTIYRVLLAEDNEINQKVIEQMLDDLPYELDIVDNGRKAVNRFRAQKPDLILMDVSMPEMDGYEATRSIRDIEQQEQLKHTPIIAMTAHVLAGDRNRCIQAGMDDYLSKPVNIANLTQAVEKWINGAATEKGGNPV